jgi:hypothetical protein
MKQAIQTKFVPCTNTKPARIKAFCARGEITIGYESITDQGFCSSGNDAIHIYVAKQLCEKFLKEDYGNIPGQNKNKPNPWAGRFVTGQLKNGDYVHVFVD